MEEVLGCHLKDNSKCCLTCTVIYSNKDNYMLCHSKSNLSQQLVPICGQHSYKDEKKNRQSLKYGQRRIYIQNLGFS